MFPELMGLFSGGNDLALARLLATEPEAIIPHLSSQGVMPPAMPVGGAGEAGEASLAFPLGEGASRGPAFWKPTPIVQRMLGRIQEPAERTSTPAAEVIPRPRLRWQPGTLPRAEAPAEGTTSPLDMSAGTEGTSIHYRGAAGPREGEAGTTPPGQNKGLLQSLAGIRTPPAPTPQRVSSPSPTRPLPLPGNASAQLAQMLLGSTPNAGGISPLLLAQALGGGRR